MTGGSGITIKHYTLLSLSFSINTAGKIIAFFIFYTVRFHTVEWRSQVSELNESKKNFFSEFDLVSFKRKLDMNIRFIGVQKPPLILLTTYLKCF